MALDLGQTTLQLLSAMDGVAKGAVSRAQRLSDTMERGFRVSADAAARRTAAVGRRPYVSARTGSEGLLDSIPPPAVPRDWAALSVDGSHIDVDCHLPLRCHLINLGGCALIYGQDSGCQMFNEPSLAMADQDLYLRRPDDPSDEALISGPLLGALRTVREVERLADAVADLPQDRPALALLDGTLAFWDLQRGNYPRFVADTLIGKQLRTALARLRAASTDRQPAAVAAYTSRPRTTEVAGAVRLMLCNQDDAECNRCCNARHSDRPRCDAAAGFDDRELFEVLLEPGHRSTLYQPSRLAARFALGHAMLVKQCQLGLGYPVAISGHDRAEFRRVALMLLEQRGLPTPESAKSVSKRRPWL